MTKLPGLSLTLFAVFSVAACDDKATPVVEAGQAGPPLGVPLKKCPNANANPLYSRIEAAHADRKREVRQLLGIMDTPTDSIESIGKMPSCAWPNDVNERVTIAETAFLKGAKLEGGTFDARAVGCEEGGQLLVGLSMGAESATFKVDKTKATLVGAGYPRAHVDLDADGKRDIVWVRALGTDSASDAGADPAKRRFDVRFANGKELPAVVGWDAKGEAGVGGVPNLSKSFALVLGGGSAPLKRWRWDGKAFAEVPEIADDDFEARVKKQQDAQTALKSDGPFAKLKTQVERCTKITTVDPTCDPVVADTKKQLVAGGFSPDESDEMIRDELGWPCKEVPDAAVAPSPSASAPAPSPSSSK